MILITDLGSLDFATALAAFTVLFLFARREWGEGLGVAAASLGSWSLYSSLKLVFQRLRPDLPHLVPAGGYSFPSGHATATAALFFTLALVYCRHSGSRSGRVLVLSVAALLTLLVGISRVYLGVHYPSDVVAGWAAGGLLAIVIAMLLRPGSRTCSS
jgi:undecaprenyl-diphosphatase